MQGGSLTWGRVADCLVFLAIAQPSGRDFGGGYGERRPRFSSLQKGLGLTRLSILNERADAGKEKGSRDKYDFAVTRARFVAGRR